MPTFDVPDPYMTAEELIAHNTPPAPDKAPRLKVELISLYPDELEVPEECRYARMDQVPFPGDELEFRTDAESADTFVFRVVRRTFVLAKNQHHLPHVRLYVRTDITS